jgi:hypothetical protein
MSEIRLYYSYTINIVLFFLPWPNSPQWAKASSFLRIITLRHTALDRTPLDEWSARSRDLYLTTHNTHKRQTSMPPAGFEPTIPASERLQTHVLDRAAILCNWLVKQTEYIKVAPDVSKCLGVCSSSHGCVHRLQYHIRCDLARSRNKGECRVQYLLTRGYPHLLLLSAEKVNSCSAKMQR